MKEGQDEFVTTTQAQDAFCPRVEGFGFSKPVFHGQALELMEWVLMQVQFQSLSARALAGGVDDKALGAQHFQELRPVLSRHGQVQIAKSSLPRAIDREGQGASFKGYDGEARSSTRQLAQDRQGLQLPGDLSQKIRPELGIFGVLRESQAPQAFSLEFLAMLSREVGKPTQAESVTQQAREKGRTGFSQTSASRASLFRGPWQIVMVKKIIPLWIALSLLAPQAWARPFVAKSDLRRCLVGNQAGLLKVVTPERRVAYSRGIDEARLAWLSEAEREQLLSALGIEPGRRGAVADQLMTDFARLPRKEAVALLGALASSPDFEISRRERVEAFLVRIMKTHADVYARRQAILALAILPVVSSDTIEQVVGHFEKSQNLWETFPVQQFFQYHAAQIRNSPEGGALRNRLAQVPSLYTPQVLASLAAQ